MKEGFPKEILEHSAHLYFFKISAMGTGIYWAIILVLFGAIGCLPLIKIDVYRTARGIVRPTSERQVISALISGKVVRNSIWFNRDVDKGDTLLLVDNNGLDEELVVCEARLEEIGKLIDDLTLILQDGMANTPIALQTAKYISSYTEYQYKLRDLESRTSHVSNAHKRKAHLFKRGVISHSEFEQISMDYGLKQSEMEIFMRSQSAIWHSEKSLLEEERRVLWAKEQALTKSIRDYVITAPVGGSLVNVTTQAESSLVHAGTKLAEISPNSTLVAECYIPPGDIGLIKKTNPVRLKLDSFDYNQWGTVSGEIFEVGRDMEILDGNPVFKVRCLMGTDILQLKNGYEGKISKGMTFTAQFHVAKRTLWQLLYDKADNWLHPGQI